jgi:hypothetical protein
MLFMDCKAKMVNLSSDLSTKSPRQSKNLNVSVPSRFHAAGELAPAPEADCLAYDKYFRVDELKKLWSITEFPDWKNESVIRPALQALEISFRFISTVLSDPRPYVNRREWKRRLLSLTKNEIELIALLCEDGDGVGAASAPIVDLASASAEVLAREGSFSAEVWKLDGETTVVSRASEFSLLPRLAAWKKSEDMAEKILYTIECEMKQCPYTLGLGEPNLSGKLSLDYDRLCKPLELHLLKKSPNLDNSENQNLYTIHQILESWIYVSQQLLKRIDEEIDGNNFNQASNYCWLIEKTWKLLSEIEDLHSLMDPADFLRLKNQLSIKSSSESDLFCFRSRGLVEITKACKDVKHKVPYILGAEVDPKGGPRIQESAMKLYTGKEDSDRIHLLQALQSIESALKRFYYSYKQLLVIVMGSVEAKASRAIMTVDSSDSLAQLFLEPTYFPSLDAAKTFLGDNWSHVTQKEMNRVELEVDLNESCGD